MSEANDHVGFLPKIGSDILAKRRRSHDQQAGGSAIRCLTIGLLFGVLGATACGQEEGDIEAETYALVTSPAGVGAGGYHSCALAGDGKVQCWGAGSVGRLGDGLNSQSSVPVDVAGLDDAEDITTGFYHSCALRATGEVACWGYNGFGQLGDGSTTSRTTPSLVSGLTDAVSVSAGAYHTCAAKANGTAVCWGYGYYGQLGNGGTSRVLTPRTVGQWVNFGFINVFLAETGIVDIAAGTFFSCARNSSGGARCWGRNQLGQLGDGTTLQRTTPTSVQLINDAVDIAAGSDHACAVRGDTSMWCWGSNRFGQLADGSTNTSPNPAPRRSTRTDPLFGWSYQLGVQTVSAGEAHTCVIATGYQRCSGGNNYGQLGNGGTQDSARFTGLVPAVQTSAGTYHTCARLPAGEVLCFGLNNYGQVSGTDSCPVNASLALVDVRSTTGDTMSKGGIHYITDYDVDLTFVASECATIDRVIVNDAALPTEPDQIEGGWYYTVLSQISLGDGTKRIIMRVHYHGLGRGDSFPIQVAVRGVADDEAVVDTMVVSVLSVIPRNLSLDYVGDGPRLHVSQNEIRNQVVASIYGRFGDDNYYARDGADLYDFRYVGLQVDVDEDGITFSGGTKANIPDGGIGCDPTIYVSGRFRIVQEGAGITTAWVDGPDYLVDFPLLCDFVTLGLLEFFVEEILNWWFDDNFQVRIDDRIRQLGRACEGIGCDTALLAINHLEGRVEIVLRPIIDSVTIRSAYNSDEVRDFDGLTDGLLGMAIPANQHLLFVTSELVQTCESPEADCDTRTVSGTGVFNFSGNPPVPSPWGECNIGGCEYWEGRQGPWDTMLGAYRNPGLLPLPSHSVAALVGRTTSETGGSFTQGAPFLAGDFLCLMPPLFGDSNSLVLGRNDHDPGGYGGWAGEYGTGDAIVTIGFLPVEYRTFFDLCEN